MEKLIELLNEYDDNNWEVTDYGELFNRMNEGISETEDLQVISKKFGFIKRLVENDKIDLHSKKLELDMKRMRIPQDYYISGVQSLDLQHKKAQYLSLIALLSIQDNPIEFLVSILK